MDYNTTDGESMDIAYVRYEPIQDPMQYRSAAQVHRGQYKSHSAYASGAQYVDNMHNDGGYEWGGVIYEDANTVASNQQGYWKPGNWKPKKTPTYEQDFGYSQSTSSYHPSAGKTYSSKTFARSGQTSQVDSFQDRNRCKGSTNVAPSYNAKGRISNSQGVTVNYPAAFGYEEKSIRSNTAKPLQVKVVNKKPADPYKVKSSQEYMQIPSPKQSYAKIPQPVILQRGVHQGTSYGASALSTNPNVKKKLTNIQNSYQSTFMGTSSSSSPYYQHDSSATTENGGGKFQPKWKTGGPGGIRKRKRTSSEKHLRLKKYVQPKNALMCLNELVQGTSLKFEQEGPITVGTPICMSVEVNGVKYRGFGSSKPNAKQAAAEAALVSFVKPPPATDDGADDKTPWGVLASFAMYKLFNEWKDGRIGMCPTGTNPSSYGSAMVPDTSYTQTLQAMLSKSMMPMETDSKPDSKDNVFSAYLSDNTKDDGKSIPNPAKKVPENAASIHPVMLLHQMRPTLVYEQSQVLKGDHQEFTITCQIDGRSFKGIGPNVKKAKYELALSANQQLFGIVSTFIPTEKN